MPALLFGAYCSSRTTAQDRMVNSIVAIAAAVVRLIAGSLGQEQPPKAGTLSSLTLLLCRNHGVAPGELPIGPLGYAVDLAFPSF